MIGPYIRLCLSQADFDQACDATHTPRAPYINPGAAATTHYLGDGDDKTNICVVCLDLAQAAGREGITVAGMLVHEAVHVWQAYCERIGETRPSSEFEAYSIQIIAQRLMWDYVRQTTEVT